MLIGSAAIGLIPSAFYALVDCISLSNKRAVESMNWSTRLDSDTDIGMATRRGPIRSEVVRVIMSGSCVNNAWLIQTCRGVLRRAANKRRPSSGRENAAVY